MITGFDGGDVGADFLNDTGNLMAQDHGRCEDRAMARPNHMVAVAYSAGHYLDQDFGPSWMVDLDVFDRVGLMGSMIYGGFHRFSSSADPARAILHSADSRAPSIRLRRAPAPRDRHR